MFTGIIEEIGIVKFVKKGPQSAMLTVEGKRIFDDLKIGDSVSTNGVCLTVTTISGNVFTADVMNETLTRSSLGSLRQGSRVNLERAMAADGRFGGHMVSGHIDGTGRISSLRKSDIAIWYTVEAEAKIMRYIVEKGSIAIDGISLTVATVGAKQFFRVDYPHTAKETILSEKESATSSIWKTTWLENTSKAYGSDFRNYKEFLLENGF